MDSRKRTVVKTISWRVVATLITAAVAFLVTGQIDVALEVGLADTFIKLGAMYFHERAWLHIRFGQRPPMPPEYNI